MGADFWRLAGDRDLTGSINDATGNPNSNGMTLSSQPRYDLIINAVPEPSTCRFSPLVRRLCCVLGDRLKPRS